MLRLAGELAEADFDVEVVVTQSRGMSNAWVPTNVEVADLAAPSLAASFLPLARHLRARQPDLLLSAVSGSNVVALVSRRLAGLDVPVVVTEHNTQSQQRMDASTLRRRAITPWLMRRLYPRADAVVCVSRGVAEDLRDFLGLPASVLSTIPNPVLSQSLQDEAARPLPNGWHERLGTAPLVVSAGRLAEHKDHATLLRAFALLQSRMPEVRLAILGDGDTAGQIKRQTVDLGLEDAVVMAGFQDNPYAWFRRATVVALSSRYEGLPTILIEALACGARVVSTDCPSGPAEILEEGRWGALVPVGDVETFASALEEAVREGRWDEPPTEALARYRSEHVAEAYRDLLQRLLSARSR